MIYRGRNWCKNSERWEKTGKPKTDCHRLSCITGCNIIFLSTCLLLLALTVSPQSELRAQRAVQLHHLSRDNGLSEGRFNQYVYQDRNGEVWISSLAGLNRFDGHHVRIYRHDQDDPASLISDAGAQSRMMEDKEGNIWFSGALALTRYNRATDDFDHFNFVGPGSDTIHNLYYWSYVDTTHQLVWSSAGRLLFNKSLETGKERFVDSLLVAWKDRMYVDRSGEVLIVQPEIDGDFILVHKYAPDGSKISSIRYDLPVADAIYDAVRDQRGVLWIGAKKGIYGLDISRYPEGRWLAAPTFRDGQPTSVVEIEIDGRGLLVAATSEGDFYRFDPRASEISLTNSLLTKEDGQSFGLLPLRTTLTNSGDFFISTEDNGVFYSHLDAVKWLTVYSQDDTGEAVDVTTDHEGTIWALYNDQVVSIRNGHKQAYSLTLGGHTNDEVTDITADEQGNIWVGTHHNLLVMSTTDESRFEVVNAEWPTDYKGFGEVYPMRGGGYLVGNLQGPSLVFDGLNSTSPQRLPQAYRVRFFEPGNDGVLLAGTYSDTLFLLGETIGNKLTLDTFFTGFDLVNDAVFDANRSGFWVATIAGLRFVARTNTGWKLEELEDKLSVPAPSTVLLSPEGILYVAAQGTIIEINARGESSSFTRSDGIDGRNFGYRAGCWSADGRPVFAGSKGLTIRDTVGSRPVPVRKPRVTGIKVNDQLIKQTAAEGTRVLNLSSKENYLTFLVSPLDYADPATAKMYYKLVGGGGSGNYRAVGQDAKLELSEMSSGSYELWLRSENSDGYRSSDTLAVIINIAPPWYRTWYAYVLYAALIVLAAFGVFWNRLKRIRKEEKRQLRQAETEARAARAEAHAAETETSVLRLQMNPHFIFNSLNAVNAYILKGDKLQAHEYLVQFADLIREILNRSARPLTRLDLAIDLLENYLKAERMRVGDGLEYAFEVDDDLDTFTTFLPTMILQPFVENAIWHGISGLERGGKITLRFRHDTEAGMLRVEVEDNGRGRAATVKSGKRHRSMAMDITRRRLEILNTSPAPTTFSAPAAAAPLSLSNVPRIAHYEIDDLYASDGTPAGTRVTLYLPADYPQEYARSSD